MFEDGIIGTPEAQADFSEMQMFPDNCAVCAETSIINQFFPDLDLDQGAAAYISATNGWYIPGAGTSCEAVGNLMEHFGIETHSVANASIEQLALELQQGHGVIVGVNSAELWDDGPLAELKNFICEIFGFDNSTYQPADHAISVTGIDVSDPENPMVIINDSGVPDGAGAKYPLDKFLDAWENSNFQYVATDNPIPDLAEKGVSDEGFWGDFNWGEWISAGAGIGTALAIGIETGNPLLAIQGGLATGKAVAGFFENDDIARMI